MSLTDNSQPVTINSDIIYNLMLQSTLPDVLNLSQVNKTTYKIYNDNYFLKTKLIKDYSIILIDLDINWKTEYIKIHNSVITITKLMEFFYLLNTERNIYLSNQNNVIDIKTVYWLPIKLKEKVINLNIISIDTYFDYKKDKHNNYKYTIRINYQKQNKREISKASISVNKEELIDFLTLSLHHYPNLYLSDCVGCPFLYKDLINLDMYDSQHRLQCWEQVYKK